mgnify:FL=1
MDSVLILGTGITGQSVGRFLKNKSKFNFFDSRERENLPAEFIRNKEFLKKLKTYKDIDLKDYSRVICSPGFDIKHPIYKEIIKKSIPLETDIEIFTREHNSKKILITGTNGKSSVCSMLEQILNKNGFKAKAIGNIGLPVLDYIEESLSFSLIEVSSFHLEISNNLKCDIAAILNITEDHLDYHKSFKNYLKTKNSIFTKAKIKIGNEINKNDIFNADIFFSSKNLGIEEQNLNAVDAILTSLNLNINLENFFENYLKLEHRFEIFHQDKKGRTYINDSKATNIGAAKEAVESAKKFGEVNILCGGRGKGVDFNKFSNFLSNNCKNIIVYGEDRNLIKSNIHKEKLYEAKDLREALKIAERVALVDEVILLSPACSSLDAFSSYYERGDTFKKMVLNE